MRAEFETMSRAFDAAAARLEALDAEARALDEAAAGAMQLYRQENAARRTTPAPAYFDAAPPAVKPGFDALAGAASMIDAARARLVEAQGQSARELERLLTDLDETTARLDGGEA
jgi:hypothetical protein